MRTTLTIEDDVAALLDRENRRAKEPMKQTVNRVLRSGLLQLTQPAKPKRFIVKPFDTSLTSEQWKSWGETKIEDFLGDVKTTVVR